MRLIVSPMPAASAGEVEREGCQTSNRSRLTVAASQKGSQRGGDLLSFDSKKELVVPSLQSTERRWAVALTGALGRENKGCRRDDADERV
ncbi:hypothetical protein BHM03_00006339 [Ensete ventricosum]|nr:hypothetical protein BHM03_00006339 [Ensete ventricosum]